jgi:hypothetical protein
MIIEGNLLKKEGSTVWLVQRYTGLVYTVNEKDVRVCHLYHDPSIEWLRVDDACKATHVDCMKWRSV